MAIFGLSPAEPALVGAALAALAAAAAVALHERMSGRAQGWMLLAPLLAAVALLGLAIASRWMRLGQGPFITLYDILLSNLFSLGLVLFLCLWRWPLVRAAAPAALAVLVLLGLWIVQVPSEGTPLPATYGNPWLWVHVAMGKVFLGLTLVAVGLCASLLLKGRTAMAGARQWDGAVWRLMTVALVFHSLMLVAGAVWAQDAWGRYWSWDPLESWAFLTWLALVFTLHLRVGARISEATGWWLVVGVFGIAFVTFFGVPFLSIAPHKGAV